MKLKRILTGLLSAAMLCTMLVAVPAGAATALAGFTDIPDAATATAAETLRLLGIVSGDGGGAFHPNNTLTRAQFCKMAVTAIGKSAEADAQMNRTIFKDVLGNYWARGYINFAASYTVGANAEGKGGETLMGGVGDGTFRPDAIITYAEAITIMMRILNYSSKDLTGGANWYDGPIATAKAIGLSDGITLNHYDTITRGQTAILFENMIFTPAKDGKEPYLTTNLNGKIVKEAVILSLDATTDDGTTGAIQITGEVPAYKTEHVPFDRALEGCRAELVLDKNDKVIAIQPSTVGSQKTVSIVSTEATYLTAAGGAKMDVAPDTIVYKGKETTSYEKVRPAMKPSTQAIFHYAANGKLEYIFLPTSETAETAAVAKATGGNPFSALVGSDTGYRVVKNGLAASISDVRQYDVGTYDKATKTLYVSDLRLTGVYQNVSPSPTTPLSITIMNVTFPVLPSAYEDLANFKVGSSVITLLLTADGQVAGAVSSSEAKSTTVGVVTKVDSINKEKSTADLSVTPLANLRDTEGKPITFTGTVSMSSNTAEKMQGQLVTISSSKVDQITVTRLASSGASGTLDVTTRTLGSLPLAENVYLYERVGSGAPVQISFDQITRSTIPASKISYVSTDYAGRVSIIVFDDVTGDQYSYGLAVLGTMSGGGSMSFTNATVSVEYSAGEKSKALVTGATIKEGSFIGVSASLESIETVPRLANWLELKALTKVSRSSFDFSDRTNEKDMTPLGTVTTSNMILPIAADVHCYNKTTKQWFRSLSEVWAYSDSLTVYYDKAPQEGGKVRLVVVE